MRKKHARKRRFHNTLTLNNRYIAAMSASVSLLWVIYILPIITPLFFTTDPLDMKQTIVKLCITGSFFIIFSAAIFFILRFISKGFIEKDKFYKKWLLFTGVGFGINLILFILIYPGHWVSDEYILLNQLELYRLETWQHIFTYLFYAYSLYIVPTAPMIVFVQFTIMSFIFGYIIAKAHTTFKTKWLTWLLFIPMLTPPILLNDLYPLRTPLYAYILLLFLFNLLLLFKSRPKNPCTTLAGFVVLLCILAFWRSEGVVLLISLPIIFFKLGLLNIKSRRFYIATTATLLALCMSYTITAITNKPEYTITATLNPLSVLLTNTSIRETSAKQIEIIDKVINVDSVVSKSSYTDIPSFWRVDGKRPALRDNFEENLTGYTPSVISIFLQNPAEFIKARAMTFAAATGLDPNNPYATLSGVYMQHGIGDASEDVKLDTFYSQNKFSQPISYTIKRSVTQSLLMVDEYGRSTPLRAIVWTPLPIAIGIIVLIITAGIKRLWGWVIILSLLISTMLIIFFAVPASYFMYYIPFYFVGLFFIVYALILLADRKKTIQKHVRM